MDAITGFGTTLAGATTLSGGVACVEGISTTGPTADSIDLTSSDSTDKYKAFAAGMIDPGEITVDVAYDGSASGSADAIIAAIGSTAETWTITYSDTSTWACSGFITSAPITERYDDRVTQSITIKCTGKPTFTDVAV